jgi:hypothetical protein
VGVLGLADDPAHGIAEAQGLLQRFVQRGPGHFLDRPDRERRVAGDALGELPGGGHEIGLGHDAAHQTHLSCGRRVDGIAGQDHLHGHGLGDGPDQALGTPAPGKEAPHDLGQAKPGFRCADAHVAEQGQLEPARQTRPVDGRDQRLLHGHCGHAGFTAGLDDGGHGRASGRPALSSLLQVGSRAERPARARQDGHADLRVRADLLQGLDQGLP